ncbi:MAG: phospholipid carrier-dependent glycosyltransferase, partial [Cyanobacteria bacterium J06648_11]
MPESQARNFFLRKRSLSPRQGWLLLALLWVGVTLVDRAWLYIDTSVPSWDPADYLRGTLVFWHALQDPQWLSGEWWHDFWTLRTKTPPLTYTAGALAQLVAGPGADRAMWAMTAFDGVLLAATFGLGWTLASVETGLWAATLTVLMPGLYRMRLEFWQDFPLVAMVTLGFLSLSYWRSTGERQSTQQRSLWPELLGAIGVSLTLGLALLTKQTALFFLAVPMLWLGVGDIVRRRWGRLGQLAGAIAVSAIVWWPWYSSNWFLMVTAGKRATIDSAAIEGDPSLASLDAWTFYARVLPHSVSWPLLAVPVVGWLGYSYWQWRERRSPVRLDPQVGWLLVFLLGGYLLATLNVNKDSRYILPLLPGLAVWLAIGLTRWGRQLGGRQVRWSLAALSIGLAWVHLFPIVPAGSLDTWSGWGIPFRATRTAWPHPQAIDAAIAAEPYLRSTIGVLPSTSDVNQHNINYYGGLQDFQVYGRQVGVKQRDLNQDARSLHWFVTKTGDQGSIP